MLRNQRTGQTCKMHLSVFLISFLAVTSSGSQFFRSSQSEADLLRQFDSGYSYADRLAQLESELIAKEIFADPSSPTFKMANFKRASPRTLQISRQARRLVETSKSLSKSGYVADDLPTLRAGNIGSLNDTCLVAPTCPSTKYRSIDGTCNNLKNPLLGSAFTTYRRLVPPNYSDGIEEPRVSVTGDDLPSARLVSTSVFSGRDSPVNVSLAVMQFGQFINHDMESSATYNMNDGTAIQCCDANNKMLPESLLHPECYPIEVPANDTFYRDIGVNRTCMSFVISVLGVRIDCSLGYADQANQNTHWLDASTVYGSDWDVTDVLRSFTSGQLLMSTDASGRKLLPLNATASSCTNKACFMAGDSRVTEQPDLAVMHTLWAREHNRIAAALALVNPTWDDDTLFEESRRILIAEMQHITYAEWLPRILNSTYLSSYGLLPSTGFSTNYVPNDTSGPVSNEFAAAAFRMGHSMVQGLVQILLANGTLSGSTFNMSKFFNDASLLVTDTSFINGAIRGLLTTGINAVDSNVTPDLWQLLFKESKQKFGFDLVALNIQRGRTHGLPGYNTYRQFCGLSKFTSFTQFPTPYSKILPTIYSSVDDIDLYAGGLMETPVAGGLVGPTFSCIIAENFAHLKQNDRFFYELGGQPHSFTSAQLTEIRKASMSRIFCDNSDASLGKIQPKAFLPPSATNTPVLCSSTSIPSINLSLWKA